MALALTLKVGDLLFIGPSITVVVAGLHSGQVRVAVEAPRDIKIDTSNGLKRLARRKQKELMK